MAISPEVKRPAPVAVPPRAPIAQAGVLQSSFQQSKWRINLFFFVDPVFGQKLDRFFGQAVLLADHSAPVPRLTPNRRLAIGFARRCGARLPVPHGRPRVGQQRPTGETFMENLSGTRNFMGTTVNTPGILDF